MEHILLTLSFCKAKATQTGPESEVLSSMDLYLLSYHKLDPSLHVMPHMANILINQNSIIIPSQFFLQ